MDNDSVHPAPSPSPGAWLTRQMERRNISVRQLAETLGVVEKTVYYWRDDKTTVSEARIPKLAEALRIPEIEVRRRLGYWVQDDSQPQRPDLRDELLELRQQLVNILDRIDEIQGRQ